MSNDVEARRERGRLELLAKGYRPHEMHWYPPMEPSPNAEPSRSHLTERQRERWRRHDEKDRLGRWTVTMDAMLRVMRAKRYKISIICGVADDIGTWLHKCHLRVLAKPFYWIVDEYEGKHKK